MKRPYGAPFTLLEGVGTLTAYQPATMAKRAVAAAMHRRWGATLGARFGVNQPMTIADREAL